MADLKRIAMAASAAIAFSGCLGLGKPYAAPAPKLHTNESYIREVLEGADLDLEDPRAVLAHVLRSLPDRVTVYPTENYYYFWFNYRGAQYAGNLNLDAADRDAGVLRFAYYLNTAEPGDPSSHHLALDSSSGVDVRRIANLSYRVAFEGRVVTFDLNDLSDVKPPPGALSSEERYLGPIHDESGMRFFLVFNGRLRAFHYVLDETAGVADRLLPIAGLERVSVGARTGFAFFQDERLDRKLLVGVSANNVETNTYFDGPFDQLPDNFIRGEELRDAILLADPSLRGTIDRYGNFDGGEERFMIAPYVEYRLSDELFIFETCAAAADDDRYYDCFVVDPGAMVPRAMKTSSGAVDEGSVRPSAAPPWP